MQAPLSLTLCPPCHSGLVLLVATGELVQLDDANARLLCYRHARRHVPTCCLWSSAGTRASQRQNRLHHEREPTHTHCKPSVRGADGNAGKIKAAARPQKNSSQNGHPTPCLHCSESQLRHRCTSIHTPDWMMTLSLSGRLPAAHIPTRMVPCSVALCRDMCVAQNILSTNAHMGHV